MLKEIGSAACMHKFNKPVYRCPSCKSKNISFSYGVTRCERCKAHIKWPRPQ